MEHIQAIIIDKQYPDGSSDRYYLGWLVSGNKTYYNLLVKDQPFNKFILAGETKPRRFELFLEAIKSHPFHSISDLRDRDYQPNRRNLLYPYEYNIDKIYHFDRFKI